MRRFHRSLAPAFGRNCPSLVLPAVCVFGFSMSAIAGDWTLFFSAVGLWIILAILPHEEGPPVIHLALTAQWMQVTAGIWYFALTGRKVSTMDACNYQPMVVIGVLSIIALAMGFRWGVRRLRQANTSSTARRNLPFSDSSLIVVDLAMVLLASVVLFMADRYYLFNQILLAVLPARIAVVFLLFRRLMRPSPHWGIIAVLLGFEVALGFTNFFSAFREPLIMLALCVIEVFDYKRESHWVRIAVVGSLIIATGVLWTEIKPAFRAHWTGDTFAISQTERFRALDDVLSNWRQQSGRDPMTGADAFVERVWAIRYPALALARVPDEVPHTRGALLWQVIRYRLEPRFLFPDKPNKPSDSLKVREYAGVWVAGEEENTSIAFGYVAESFVDFGIPLMFVLVFLLGAMWGGILQWLRKTIHFEELGIAVTALLGWVNLYQFERSWLMTLGFGLTMVLVIGVLAVITDRTIISLSSRRCDSSMRVTSQLHSYASGNGS